MLVHSKINVGPHFPIVKVEANIIDPLDQMAHSHHPLTASDGLSLACDMMQEAEIEKKLTEFLIEYSHSTINLLGFRYWKGVRKMCGHMIVRKIVWIKSQPLVNS